MAEHILVGLSSAPSNARIIRTAATMAAAFGCKFTALFVRTPGYDAMSDENKERLRTNTELAKRLGATVETVFGDDVSYQIAEYARLSGVTKIVVGRSAATRKHPWGKPTLTEKLTAIAPNLDIHIIPDASVDGSYKPKKAKRKVDLKTTCRDWALTLGILILATVLSFGFSQVGFTEANIIAVYLLAALLTSMVTSTRSSYVLSAIGGVLVFNFFFTTPMFSLRVHEHGAPLTFLIMIVAALIVGTLTDRLKSQVKQSTQAAYRTNLLFETSQMLQKATSDDKIFQTVRTQVAKLLGRHASVLPGVTASSRKDALRYPIKVQDRIYGTVIIEGSEPLEAFENSVLLSILGEAALALENDKNAREKEAAAVLAESEQLRANLLRTISHDLRTPLTSISGHASNLMMNGAGFDEETKQQLYTDIYNDSMWLIELVENLLYATRIEEGRMTLNTSTESLSEIVEEAVRRIGRKTSEHIFTVSCEDDYLLVRADAKLIVQVITNIVDNAVKYTPPGTAISLTAGENNGKAEVVVADTGNGVPDEVKAKIFEKFYCGTNKIADNRRSLGLGLYLCKAIVEAHGGELTVSDNQPHGAIFRFTLPLEEVSYHE